MTTVKLNQGIQKAKRELSKVSIKLLPHQEQALHWMVRREKTKGRGENPCGILADDMGLGKTLA